MISPYYYLERFIPGGNDINDNWFSRLPQEEISEGERLLKQSFSNELNQFYHDIGYGMLRSPNKVTEGYTFSNNNEILLPTVAASFYQGIIEHQTEPKEEALEYDDHWLALSTLEMLQPGDLPFFEIGDSCRFLVMKPLSDNPNAVWALGDIKIEDSFERFIYRLYYESPWFYDDIIEAYYADK